jgi:hypothetical protein
MTTGLFFVVPSETEGQFGIWIWTLTRRIEDDASTSPYQGEAIRTAFREAQS